MDQVLFDILVISKGLDNRRVLKLKKKKNRFTKTELNNFKPKYVISFLFLVKRMEVTDCGIG